MELPLVKEIFTWLDFYLMHDVSLKKTNFTLVAQIDVLRRLVHSLKT